MPRFDLFVPKMPIKFPPGKMPMPEQSSFLFPPWLLPLLLLPFSLSVNALTTSKQQSIMSSDTASARTTPRSSRPKVTKRAGLTSATDRRRMTAPTGSTLCLQKIIESRYRHCLRIIPVIMRVLILPGSDRSARNSLMSRSATSSDVLLFV